MSKHTQTNANPGTQIFEFPPPPTPPPPADTPANEPPTTPPVTPPENEPPTTPVTPSPETFSQADIDRAVKNAQKDWAKKLQDAEDAKTLSKTELLEKENQTLKHQGFMAKAEKSILEALEKAEALNPKLMFAAKKGELDFDENGKLKNLDDIISDLKAEFPNDFGVRKPDESIDAGAGNSGSNTRLTRAMINKMTPQQLIDNMEEVDKFLASLK